MGTSDSMGLQGSLRVLQNLHVNLNMAEWSEKQIGEPMKSLYGLRAET